MSKYILKQAAALLLIASLASGCKKSDDEKYETAFGIGYTSIYPIVPNSFVEVDLSTGSVTDKVSVEAIEGLGNHSLFCRAYSLGLYLFRANPLEVGAISLSDNSFYKIDLSADQSICGINALLVDEGAGTLYIVATTYYEEQSEYRLSLVSVDLSARKVIKKVDIVSPEEVHYHFMADIDYDGKRIFFKPTTGNTLYIFDYAKNTLLTKPFDYDLYDLHFCKETNSLFGLTVNIDDAFYLASYSLKSFEYSLNGKLDGIEVILTDCLYYCKQSGAYFVGSPSGYNKNLLRVDPKTAKISKTVILDRDVRKLT